MREKASLAWMLLYTTHMLISAAQTIPVPDETLPTNANAKTKGSAASPAIATDFSLFISQFLGAVAQNTQQTARNTTITASFNGITADAASQAVSDAPGKMPDIAVMLLGIKKADAVSSDEATEIPEQAKDAKNIADAPDENGTADALFPEATNSTETDESRNNGTDISDKTGNAAAVTKKDFYDLLAKQTSPKNTVDDNKAVEPADTSPGSTAQTRSDPAHAASQGPSPAYAVQAQISGATTAQGPHKGSDLAPSRVTEPFDSSDSATTIVKDGNRLAVKFEQDGLGKLDLDLRLDKGMISAHIHAADDTTKTLIENNMQQIVDSLLKAGLSIGGFSVSLKGGGQRNMTQDEYGAYKTKQISGEAGTAGGSAPRITANSMVSIFI